MGDFAKKFTLLDTKEELPPFDLENSKAIRLIKLLILIEFSGLIFLKIKFMRITLLILMLILRKMNQLLVIIFHIKIFLGKLTLPDISNVIEFTNISSKNDKFKLEVK